jgi:hypothetical protein
VEVIYDKAVQDMDPDIDDESTWHIRHDRESTKATRENKSFGSDQILRYIERERQATEAFPPTATEDAEAPQGGNP